jgi:hypothetical protein
VDRFSDLVNSPGPRPSLLHLNDDGPHGRNKEQLTSHAPGGVSAANRDSAESSPSALSERSRQDAGQFALSRSSYLTFKRAPAAAAAALFAAW